MQHNQSLNVHLPYKSAAIALLFSMLLGPIGLLYASFWGGFFMIMLGIIAATNTLYVPLILIWLASCIWSVGAVEVYNKKIYHHIQKNIEPAQTV